MDMPNSLSVYTLCVGCYLELKSKGFALNRFNGSGRFIFTYVHLYRQFNALKPLIGGAALVN